jgi:hypothetical protein
VSSLVDAPEADRFKNQTYLGYPWSYPKHGSCDSTSLREIYCIFFVHTYRQH